jgi:hypothetical protein
MIASRKRLGEWAPMPRPRITLRKALKDILKGPHLPFGPQQAKLVGFV